MPLQEVPQTSAPRRPRRDLRRPHLPAPPARSAGRSRGAPADRHHGPRRATSPAGPPSLPCSTTSPRPDFQNWGEEPHAPPGFQGLPTGSRRSGEVSPSAGQTRELLISSSPRRPCLALWVAWFQTFPDFSGCSPSPSPDRTPEDSPCVELGPGPSSAASSPSPRLLGPGLPPVNRRREDLAQGSEGRRFVSPGSVWAPGVVVSILRAFSSAFRE